MPIDAGEAAIRTVIAEALIEHGETSGRGLDALSAMRQAEAIVKALEYAGYEISRYPGNLCCRPMRTCPTAGDQRGPAAADCPLPAGPDIAIDSGSSRMPSRPGEFHPEPLTDPDVNLSIHPARAIA
jgi:hypothetical protein